PAARLAEATPIGEVTLAEVTPIAEQEPEPVPAAPVAEATPIAEPEPKNEYIPHVEAAQEAEGSRFGAGYFWGLLTGLLVGAILFMIYVLITTSSEPLSTYEIEDEAAAAAITAIE
ncbi:MAG: hypothetical protein K2I58_00600, partial [Candidatus Amulumruptor sp.]|nr:hypothetical protein [Candidatus Amulumruptor sp.]